MGPEQQAYHNLIKQRTKSYKYKQTWAIFNSLSEESIMFLKAVSRFLVPNLDRDLTHCVRKELATASIMTDSFLAPSVYGYERQATQQHGMAQATAAVQQRSGGEQFVKVHYPVPPQGLFFQ